MSNSIKDALLGISKEAKNNQLGDDIRPVDTSNDIKDQVIDDGELHNLMAEQSPNISDVSDA